MSAEVLRRAADRLDDETRPLEGDQVELDPKALAAWLREASEQVGRYSWLKHDPTMTHAEAVARAVLGEAP